MDPASSGAGQTMEEVRTMPAIPWTDLMAYFDAVRAVTRHYLEQATDADLSQEYSHPRLGSTDRSLDRRAYPRRGKPTRGAGGISSGA